MPDETKIGRPTKYDDSLCARIIELMAEGLSLTAAAADLDIHRETAYAWERDGNHPDFADALKLARGKRTLKLERDLLKASDGPTVTSRIFALKNACADEWRDKHEHEHGGKDGKPFQINISAVEDQF